MDNNTTTTTPNGVLTRIADTLTISRAEYTALLRDKTELDLVLAIRLQSSDYSFDALALLDTILKKRGLKA